MSISSGTFYRSNTPKELEQAQRKMEEARERRRREEEAARREEALRNNKEQRTEEGGPLVCELCGRPVTVYRQHYEVHERMHWLCFHIVFEHEGDPDEPCEDSSCPQWHRQVFRREIKRLGRDPDEVLVEEAMEERYGL